MSSGAQSYIAIAPADPTDPAAIPSGDAEYVNFSSDDLTAGIGTTQSNHVRPDRMTTDVIVTSMEVGGGFTNELHFEQDANDKLIAAFMWASWQGILDTGSPSISAENAVITGDLIDMSACAAIPNNIYHPGCRVRLTGCGDSENDGIRKWFYHSPSVWRVEPAFNSDETLGAQSIAYTRYIKNASEFQPLFIERGHVDVGEFFQFMGMTANTWAVEVPDQDIITNTFGFVGFETDVVQTPTFANYDGPATTDSMSSVTNVGSIELNDTPLESCLVQAVSMEINNNVEPNTGVGVFGACRTTAHKFEVTGSLTMYFNSSQMYQWLLNGNEFSFAIEFVDPDDNTYIFRMPRCKMSEDAINVSSGDDEVMDDAAYMALADSETEAQLIIYKFPA